MKSLTTILSYLFGRVYQTSPDPSGVRRESDTLSVVDGLIPTARSPVPIDGAAKYKSTMTDKTASAWLRGQISDQAVGDGV